MAIRLGVVMDPIASIHFAKDSTLALLWEAQDRGWQMDYFEINDLYLQNGLPYGQGRSLQVFRDAITWFALKDTRQIPLTDLNVILMRKDPPVDPVYWYATYILEYAEQLGVLVVNRPQALRDANEKMFAMHFPACCPPTLVTSSVAQLHLFWQQHRDIVCKPLHGMGGAGVFRVLATDPNAMVIFTMLTHDGRVPIMAQLFIPEIKAGDKRILLINGEPFQHALVRIPQGKEWRGNLAVGAKGEVQPLSEQDRWICAQVGPVLRERGLYWVGLDIIGRYLTEINVTSPTGIRELDAKLHCHMSVPLLDGIEVMINKDR